MNRYIRAETYRIVKLPDCGCPNPDYGIDKSGRLFCRNCQRRLQHSVPTYDISAERFLELVGPSPRKGWASVIEIGGELLGFRRESAQGDPRTAGDPPEGQPGGEGEPGAVPDAEELERLREENSDLMKKLEEANAQRLDRDNQISTLNNRLECANETNRSVKEDNARLRRDLGDVTASYRHVQSELADASAIDVRELTKVFLDHMTWMYNAALDADDLEKLRGSIKARTDYAAAKAAGVGLTVTRHERGSRLGSERMDIEEVPTGDPELSALIAKSRLFGCTFSNDLPPIVESVDVYRLRKPEPPAEEAPAVHEEPSAEEPREAAAEPGIGPEVGGAPGPVATAPGAGEVDDGAA